MKMKNYIIIVIIVVLLIGGYFVQQNISKISTLEIQPAIQTNPEKMTSMDQQISENEFIKNLCNNGYEIYYHSKLRYSVEVQKCGKYYSVSPTDVLDAGRVNVDKNGKVATFCGGMPEERGELTPDSLCNIECDNKNLCIGIEIDCSTIKYKNTQEDRHSDADEEWYTAMKNFCYLENAIRMNDKKYCDSIADEYQKERCLKYESGF